MVISGTPNTVSGAVNWPISTAVRLFMCFNPAVPLLEFHGNYTKEIEKSTFSAVLLKLKNRQNPNVKLEEKHVFNNR